MKVKYPPNCNTEVSKIGFLNRSDELLREEHNAKGALYLNGGITLGEWETYKIDVFMPTFQAIDMELSKQSSIAKKSNFWPVDLGRDIRNGN